MKELSRDAVIDILRKSGITEEKIDKVIGTLGISLARQAAKAAEKSIIFDKSTLSDLEESLRIGANLTPNEAKKILINVESTVKVQDEPEVKFLGKGAFEVKGDSLRFKLGE